MLLLALAIAVLEPGDVRHVEIAGTKLSYEAYLPKAFDGTKPWPVLYVLDPRGRGERIARVLEPIAEERGVVVIASNDVRSDEKGWPNEEAIRATWNDAHARVKHERAWAAGFSGGARLAWAMAMASEGEIEGVLLAGAAHAPEFPPSKEKPIATWLAIGRHDFNWLEVHAFEKEVAKTGARHRLVSFDGGHRWPPDELLRDALEWLARDEASRTRRADAARAMEARGNRLDALAEWKSLARDFDGPDAREAIARLEKDKKLRTQREERETRDELDRRWNDSVQPVIDSLQPEHPLPFEADLVRDLDLPALLDESVRHAGTYRGDSATRRLEQLFVRFSFYIPRELAARKEHRRAALSLAIAARIKPGDAATRYDLACMLAQAGRKKEALAALEKAVQLGFADRAKMESDPDLAPLRDSKRFRALLPPP